MSEKLLCVREASQLLGILEKELIELGQRGEIPCFRVGGEFYRFKRQDILAAKNEIQKMFNVSQKKSTLRESLSDYFYFNSFYFASGLIIAVLLFLIIFYD